MKKIFRMIFFSASSLYLTALWNKGFIISSDLRKFLITTFLMALVIYLILPITKVILLPFNIITLGLISVLAYFLIFYFFTTRFDLIEINSWIFSGLKFYPINIGEVHISSTANIVVSAISVSTFINFLEALL